MKRCDALMEQISAVSKSTQYPNHDMVEQLEEVMSIARSGDQASAEALLPNGVRLGADGVPIMPASHAVRGARVESIIGCVYPQFLLQSLLSHYISSVLPVVCRSAYCAATYFQTVLALSIPLVTIGMKAVMKKRREMAREARQKKKERREGEPEMLMSGSIPGGAMDGEASDDAVSHTSASECGSLGDDKLLSEEQDTAPFDPQLSGTPTPTSGAGVGPSSHGNVLHMRSSFQRPSTGPSGNSGTNMSLASNRRQIQAIDTDTGPSPQAWGASGTAAARKSVSGWKGSPLAGSPGGKAASRFVDMGMSGSLPSSHTAGSPHRRLRHDTYIVDVTNVAAPNSGPIRPDAWSSDAVSPGRAYVSLLLDRMRVAGRLVIDSLRRVASACALVNLWTQQHEAELKYVEKAVKDILSLFVVHVSIVSDWHLQAESKVSSPGRTTMGNTLGDSTDTSVLLNPTTYAVSIATVKRGATPPLVDLGEKQGAASFADMARQQLMAKRAEGDTMLLLEPDRIVTCSAMGGWIDMRRDELEVALHAEEARMAERRADGFGRDANLGAEGANMGAQLGDPGSGLSRQAQAEEQVVVPTPPAPPPREPGVTRSARLRAEKAAKLVARLHRKEQYRRTVAGSGPFGSGPVPPAPRGSRAPPIPQPVDTRRVQRDIKKGVAKGTNSGRRSPTSPQRQHLAKCAQQDAAKHQEEFSLRHIRKRQEDRLRGTALTYFSDQLKGGQVDEATATAAQTFLPDIYGDAIKSGAVRPPSPRKAIIKKKRRRGRRGGRKHKSRYKDDAVTTLFDGVAPEELYSGLATLPSVRRARTDGSGGDGSLSARGSGGGGQGGSSGGGLLSSGEAAVYIRGQQRHLTRSQQMRLSATEKGDIYCNVRAVRAP